MQQCSSGNVDDDDDVTHFSQVQRPFNGLQLHGHCVVVDEDNGRHDEVDFKGGACVIIGEKVLRRQEDRLVLLLRCNGNASEDAEDYANRDRSLISHEIDLEE